MQMQVYLEAYSLWEAIDPDAVARKKDCQAFSVIFGELLEDIMTLLDIFKISK